MHSLATTCCLLFVAPIAAQEPEARRQAQPAQRLVLHVELLSPGAPVPRIADEHAPPALAKVRTWQGRKIAWRLDGAAITNQKDAAAALHRAATDPKNHRDSKHRPGTREPLPLRVEPADGLRWGEVLATYDMALAAGFEELQFEDVPTPWFVPRSVMEPILDDGVLVVPKVIYSEPDDRPEAGRPTFDVHQDGRIVHDEAVLFVWTAGKEDDLGALRKRLLELRQGLIADGRLRVRAYDGEKRLDMPLLVRADLWTEWRDVRRLLMLATSPEIGFWQLQAAGTEVEYEPKLRSGWRPPESTK
ncbi:MAG: hypothetical protein IT455_13835 [Planctomycetes bacterium]|nr:hypothetical protein [Planctomycetota bacterium]